MRQTPPRLPTQNLTRPARITKTLIKQIPVKTQVALCEEFRLAVIPTGKRGHKGIDYLVALHSYVSNSLPALATLLTNLKVSK
jgi:hypothetical protein